MKNKIVAALLAFLGGMIGAHKFYLRDPGAGIFYIFMTMMTADFFPISALLGFIDGLRYLMMSPEEFDRKFNRRYYKERPRRRVERRRNRQRDYYEVRKTDKSKKRVPKLRSNPFKKSGIKKYKEYDIEEAIEDFHKGLKIEPKDVALHFNLACAYSLLENKDLAFKHLDLAVDYGLKDQEKIMTHDDLAFLRIQPEFDAFKEAGYQIEPQKKIEQAKQMDDILLAQLNRLMELRKKGVLTESEYARERKKVMAR